MSFNINLSRSSSLSSSDCQSNNSSVYSLSSSQLHLTPLSQSQSDKFEDTIFHLDLKDTDIDTSSYHSLPNNSYPEDNDILYSEEKQQLEPPNKRMYHFTSDKSNKYGLFMYDKKTNKPYLFDNCSLSCSGFTVFIISSNLATLSYMLPIDHGMTCDEIIFHLIDLKTYRKVLFCVQSNCHCIPCSVKPIPNSPYVSFTVIIETKQPFF